MKAFRPLILGSALVLASLIALPAPSARAASIGVNFVGSSSALDPTASAGATPYAQTHYNNVNLPSSGLVLDDNTGTPTTALLTAISSGSGGFTTPVAGADEMLNVGAAATSNVSQSFTLANIPYSNYSLSVYDLGLGAGFVQGISLGNTTYYTSSPNPTGAGYLDDNNATPFTYTLGTSTSAAAPTANADYVLFTGLSGSTLTITETKTSGNLALLPGFQIIQVPEPSTWALLGVGAVGAGVATMRRRRLT